MNKILISTAAAAFLAATGIASAQVTNSPSPGQTGPSVAPGASTSSNNDPNNPGATRNTTGSGMQQGGGMAPAGSTIGSDTKGMATPTEKSPDRNNPVQSKPTTGSN